MLRAEHIQRLVRGPGLPDECLQQRGGGIHCEVAVIFAVRRYGNLLSPLAGLSLDEMFTAHLIQGVGKDEVYPLEAELLQDGLGAALLQAPVCFAEMVTDGLLNGARAADVVMEAVIIPLELSEADGLCP